MRSSNLLLSAARKIAASTALIAVLTVNAQTPASPANDPVTVSSTDATTKAAKDANGAGMPQTATTPRQNQNSELVKSSDHQGESDVVKLSPFTVSSKNDKGFRSEQTLIGSRIAKDLVDIPGSITIINKQLIDDLHATDVHQVLQFGVAGVTQNQTINDDFNIRGFRSMFSLRDGETKDSYKRNAMYDVERIEVIKGPMGMLLGNNTFLGGGVNFVTIKPTHKPAGNVDLTFGPHNYVRLAANTMGPAYQSPGLTVDYRLTVGGLRSDSDREIENQDQNFLGAGLTFQFGPNTSLTVVGDYFRDNGYFYWADFLDYSSTLGTAKNPMVAKLNQNSGKSFSPAQHKNAYWKNQDSFIDATFLTKLTENSNLRLYYFGGNIIDRRRIVRGITIMPDNHTLARQDLPFVLDEVTNDVQADFTHKLQTSVLTLDTTIGADGSTIFNRTDTSNNTPFSSIDTANVNFAADDAYFAVPRAGAGLPNQTAALSRPKNFSYYIQENLSFFNDRLILVGGMRWFVPGGDTKNNITGVITDLPDTILETHKYGVVVKPVPGVSVYYTEATNSFPQVGFTDLFHTGDSLNPLHTQQGKMKEYGLKVGHQFSDSLSAYGTVAHYDMSLTNVRIGSAIIPGTNPPEIGNVENTLGDLAQGWEFEYGLRYSSATGSFDFLGTYADGKSQTAADRTLPAKDFVPRKTSLLVKYAWSNGALSGLMCGANYYEQSRKQESNFYIDWPALYGVFAGYTWGRDKVWTIQLNADNVTNKRYIVAIAAGGLVQTVAGVDSKLEFKYRW
ncbi:MAG: TonB-dependent siderophore receptor [Verrucomicrobia bacterium]|nr:TonB-dependent siderophore receptor [Verrucomicrobiota bacterium]